MKKKKNYPETKESYSKKLKDPRWQKKRLEVLNRDGWCCQGCGDKESTLHVHHKVYRCSNPWEALMSDLITLCEDCHNIESQDRPGEEQRLIRTLRKAGLLNSHLINLNCFFEQRNDYFDLLSDEKWLNREKEILKDDDKCFICEEKTDLVIYHKRPSSVIHRPWEICNSHFELICKSCNRIYGGYNICDYLDFLIPAFHAAGFYSEDITDLVTLDHFNHFISAILDKIKKSRLEDIPSQFADDGTFKKNITYRKLFQLNQKAESMKKNSKLVSLHNLTDKHTLEP